jgi:hypothetical protein
MGLAFKQLGVYVRVACLVVLLAAILLILFKNRNNEVRVWFFGLTDPNRPLNVVPLILSTAATTLLVWRILGLGHGLWKDIRELQQSRLLRELAESQKLREKETTREPSKEEKNDPDGV